MLEYLVLPKFHLDRRRRGVFFLGTLLDPRFLKKKQFRNFENWGNVTKPCIMAKIKHYNDILAHSTAFYPISSYIWTKIKKFQNLVVPAHWPNLWRCARGFFRPLVVSCIMNGPWVAQNNPDNPKSCIFHLIISFSSELRSFLAVYATWRSQMWGWCVKFSKFMTVWIVKHEPKSSLTHSPCIISLFNRENPIIFQKISKFAPKMGIFDVFHDKVGLKCIHCAYFMF